jgi:alkylhydroperoxidase family enzyme
MPRLRQVPRAEVAPEFAELFERFFPNGQDPVQTPGTATGTPGNWWTTFALVPDVLRAYWTSYRESLKPDALDPKLRELGVMRAGFNVGSQFVFSQHCKGARGVGVPEEQIAAIPGWATSDAFSPVERAVLAYADELTVHRGRVQDATFDALRAHLSDEAIVQLTYSVGEFRFFAIVSRALQLEYDDVPERIEEIPAPAPTTG